jgi:hypothetical protein
MTPVEEVQLTAIIAFIVGGAVFIVAIYMSVSS